MSTFPRFLPVSCSCPNSLLRTPQTDTRHHITPDSAVLGRELSSASFSNLSAAIDATAEFIDTYVYILDRGKKFLIVHYPQRALLLYRSWRPASLDLQSRDGHREATAFTLQNAYRESAMQRGDPLLNDVLMVNNIPNPRGTLFNSFNSFNVNYRCYMYQDSFQDVATTQKQYVAVA